MLVVYNLSMMRLLDFMCNVLYINMLYSLEEESAFSVKK